MPAKKTIAIVGATEKEGAKLACLFAGTGYRLLLVSNNGTALTQLLDNIILNGPTAEIDTIECVKDGCWEADIIILTVSADDENEVAQMMKEVATQKIVVSISGKKSEVLRQVLPYSKLVKISSVLSKEIFISGEDEEANDEIAQIFLHAGCHPVLANGISIK